MEIDFKTRSIATQSAIRTYGVQYFLAALALGFVSALQAQIPHWSWAVDPACGYWNQEVLALTSDSLGGTYVAGVYSEIVDFDPGPGQSISEVGYNDRKGFISRYKMDAVGQWEWARTFQLKGKEDIKSLALDGEGSVYIGGFFSGTTDFDPGPESAVHTAVGGEDGFICKLDSAGSFDWVVVFPGDAVNDIRSLLVNQVGNLVCMGVFAGQVDLDPGPDTTLLVSGGGQDFFVAELDGDGRLQWVEQFGGKGKNIGQHMAIDPAGQIYVCGSTVDTMDADPGPGFQPLAGEGGFAIKLSEAGELVWARRFGGSDTRADAIQVDPQGNILVAGSFHDGVDFDPGTNMHMLRSNGDRDVFVMMLTEEGKLNWAKAIGGPGVDRANSLLAGDNAIFVAGAYTGEIDFDPGPGVTLFTSTNANAYESYILRLDGSGRYQWALTGSQSWNDQVNALAWAPDHKLVAGGNYNGWIDFGAESWDPGECKWDPTTGGYMAVASNIEGEMPSFSLLSASGPRCHGEANGNAFLWPENGTPPFMFRWPNGLQGQYVNSLGGGTYSVTMTDALGAKAIGRVIMEQPAPLSIMLDFANAQAGLITVTPAGGTTPYAYAWTGPEGDTYNTQDLYGLVELGMYALTVTDANGCSEMFEMFLGDTETAIEDASKPVPLQFFPNPSADVIHILGDHAFERIEVFGIDGRSCLRIVNLNTNRLDISGLPEGCYQVRAIAGRQWHVGRVVKSGS